MSTLLERWRAFIETNPEAVAERLDLLDRVQTSPWVMHYPELLSTVRMYVHVLGTEHEPRWASLVLDWARRIGEREAESEVVVHEARDARIREELGSGGALSEGEPAARVYAGRGGGRSDCDPGLVRLAIFSRAHRSEAYRADFGCRDLTPDEARAVAARLLAEAAAVDGAS